MDNYILGLDAKDNATPKIERFGKKLGEVEGKFKGFSGKLGDALKELPGFGGALDVIGKGPLVGAAAGLAAVGVGFASMVKSQIDFADNMNDMSTKLGISTEKLSVLKLYADQSGTTIETLAANMGKLGVKIANGDKDLKKYGVTAGSTDEALFQLADKIAATEDPMMRLKIATDAFGKSGQEMLPLLVQGGTALREMAASAPIVSTSFAKASDEMNDKIANLKGRFQTVALGITEWILPQMDKWMEGVERIRIALGMVTKEEDYQAKRQEARNKIISQYAELLEKRKEGEKLIGKVKGPVEIGGLTLQESLAAFDRNNPKNLPTAKTPEPKQTNYESEEDIKKRESAKIKAAQESAKKLKEIEDNREKDNFKLEAAKIAREKKARDEWEDQQTKLEEDAAQRNIEQILDSQKAKDEWRKEQKEKERAIEEKEIADRKQRYLDLGNSMANSLSGPMDTFISDMIEGNKFVEESFADMTSNMTKNFISMLTQMATQMAAKAAIFGILNLVTGGSFGGIVGGLSSFIKPFATGTNYAPGGVALVGEEGPELINLPRGSKVSTAQKSKQASGNFYQTLNFKQDITPKQVVDISVKSARQIELERKFRRGY